MKHLGDITKINGALIEPVDCITFGSPCQDLSIAGKRAGLAGERSGLFMEATRIIKEMRGATNGLYPTFAIWENVAGAFSSNGGEDFRAVLEELARCIEPDATVPGPNKGKWEKAGCIAGNQYSIAWRTFDAQYWGVPQRRRRIAAVLDLRGQRAGEVLFELEGLPGDPKAGLARYDRLVDGTGVFRDGVMCLQGGGATSQNSQGMGYHEEVAYTLNTTDVHGVTLCLNDQGGSSINVESGDRSPTLRANSHQHEPIVAEPAPQTVKIRGGVEVDSHGNKAGKGALIQNDLSATLGVSQDQYLFQPVPAYTIGGADLGSPLPESVGTLTGEHENRVTNTSHVVLAQSPYGLDRASFNQGKNAKYSFSVLEDQQPTLTAMGPGAVAAMSADMFHGNSFEEVTPPLLARDYKNPNIVTSPIIRWIVRRLTPRECERLQGFPDDWTNIGEWYDSKGKLHKDSDSPRYKALGNSIALPQWWWITCKMATYLRHSATLGSLFDGIGGFPLVWQERHGEYTARWASEIEEFPIAVTKVHFPEPDSDSDWMR